MILPVVVATTPLTILVKVKELVEVEIVKVLEVEEARIWLMLPMVALEMVVVAKLVLLLTVRF